VPYVLERYRQAGTEVFRTDRDGQIDLSTDGRSLRVRTFTGRGHESTTDREKTKETRDHKPWRVVMALRIRSPLSEGLEAIMTRVIGAIIEVASAPGCERQASESACW